MSRRREGGAAVELALVLPVLLVLVAGTLDWGWMLVQQAAVVQIARDGAHAGVLADEGPAAIAELRAHTALDASGFPPEPGDVVATLRSEAVGDVLEVRVDIPYRPLIGLVPTPDRLAARTTMLWRRP